MNRRKFFKKAFFTGSALSMSLFIDNKIDSGNLFAQEANKMFDSEIKTKNT